MNAAASVIVPVRNGRRDLEGLLEALARQTFPRERFEVVIGDDGSTDGAPDSLATEDGWIKVVSGPPRNSYAARNRAVAAASAPVLAFCDADCRPEPNWLEAGLAALQEGFVVAGLIRFQVPEVRSVWTLLDLDTFLDQERAVQSGNAVTANLFVRRELFDKVSGFDDSLPEHGDYDFVSRCVQAGARLVYSPKAVVWHPTRDGAKQFLRKVWVMNRWYAARASRARTRISRLRIGPWVPVLPQVLTRKRAGRSLLLDRTRLRANGVSPRLLEDVRALPLMYIVIPYFQGAAQLRGWWEGRRLRT